ncbi:hypothetical protein [Pleurocapsa sp. FMAR1]|uniref:hypothetical protein n=1 Tax=Pleurocapsa sp. FMAR1 TaxID=3040204 RepID=UPI0029C913F3|nr:hypothetical protein [Pleurocapsa sp. FMAR1]
MGSRQTGIGKDVFNTETPLCFSLACCYFNDRFVDTHGAKQFLYLAHNQAITDIQAL